MNAIPKGRTLEQHNTLSAAQARVLTAMSDHTPGGRLRFTVDLASGAVEVEPAVPATGKPRTAK